MNQIQKIKDLIKKWRKDKSPVSRYEIEAWIIDEVNKYQSTPLFTTYDNKYDFHSECNLDINDDGVGCDFDSPLHVESYNKYHFPILGQFLIEMYTKEETKLAAKKNNQRN